MDIATGAKSLVLFGGPLTHQVVVPRAVFKPPKKQLYAAASSVAENENGLCDDAEQSNATKELEERPVARVHYLAESASSPKRSKHLDLFLALPSLPPFPPSLLAKQRPPALLSASESEVHHHFAHSNTSTSTSQRGLFSWTPNNNGSALMLMRRCCFFVFLPATHAAGMCDAQLVFRSVSRLRSHSTDDESEEGRVGELRTLRSGGAHSRKLSPQQLGQFIDLVDPISAEEHMKMRNFSLELHRVRSLWCRFFFLPFLL